MKTNLLIAAGIVIAFSSCVPKRKLISEQNRVRALQSDSASTHHSLDDCYGRVAGLSKTKDSLQNNLQSLALNSKMTIQEQASRLNRLETLIQSQRDVLNKLKKTVADALINFKPDQLTVTLKDGKLYVSLQEKLLFKSGSADVGPEGKQALQSLAAVLINSPDIDIDVEGHTDTVPITGKFQDNWALSVARATAIVRVLTKDYGVNPQDIIASGRGEFHPVATNNTPDGRQLNRRTEIILQPDLSELFKLLNQ